MSKLVVADIENASGVEEWNITLGTEQASTSGTSISFTSIPSGVKQIVMTLDGVSTDAATDLLIQIGDSGGVETTGYQGGCGDSGSQELDTTGFVLTRSTGAASEHSGMVLFAHSSGNTWHCTGGVTSHASTVHHNDGAKTLSAELDRIILTTQSGSANFDAGVVNIQYQF